MTQKTGPRLALHWQILIAIAIAVPAGLLAGEDAGILGVSFSSVFDFLGTLFINALKMLIVPLIASSMIVGVANIGSGGALGVSSTGSIVKISSFKFESNSSNNSAGSSGAACSLPSR